MQDLRQAPDAGPVLSVAGPFELLPAEGPGERHGPGLAKALAAAHAALKPDLLVLTPGEADWLAAQGATAPAHHTLSSRAQGVVLPTPGGPVGVVLFPPLPPDAEAPPDAMAQDVIRQARELAARVRLVVGVSPWGELAEDRFLRTAGPVVDILLGAGPGPGVAGRFTPDGKTFWARSYGLGKALHAVRIAAWPERTPAWQWVRDENLRLDFLGLTEAFAADPAMQTLLDGFTLPQ